MVLKGLRPFNTFLIMIREGELVIQERLRLSLLSFKSLSLCKRFPYGFSLSWGKRITSRIDC